MEYDVLNNLRCPQCRAGLKKEKDLLSCLSCNRQYKIVNGIPDFREKDEYWCNVRREKMQQLNSLAKKSNDWLSAAERMIPEYVDHIKPFYRADCQFLWPTGKNSRILDAGSMWGGITIPAAQYHQEVYAIDKTLETLEFLTIRAKQMGFQNIYTVAGSIKNLPFADNFFDMVILSGVLEWVGIEEEITLEEQWQKNGTGLKMKQVKKYVKTPKEMQVEVLQEIHRVLKPDGHLYLAIENRVGYIYLAGWPDPHMNLPFISFLPRFLADFITKVISGSPYRTYIYTIAGYKSLLKQAGFFQADFYGVFNHYVKPLQAIPLQLVDSLKKNISDSGRWQLKIMLKFIPAKWLAYLSPSIICLAAKNKKQVIEPRIEKIFQAIGILSDGPSGFEAVKWSGRLDNDIPVNYLVYINAKINKEPSYFCKISRNKDSKDVLESQANNLALANALLKNTTIASAIPELVYSGQVGGVALLITKYLPGKPVNNFLLDKLKNSPFSLLNHVACYLWLKTIEDVVIKALDFLAAFQKYTTVDNVNAKIFLDSEITYFTSQIGENGLLDNEILGLIKELKEKISRLSDINITICFEHGDYDLCNLLLFGKKLCVVDFEHSEHKKMPFFDLGTLLFSPLLIQYKKTGRSTDLKDFADSYGWSQKLNIWVDYYSRISGISKDILKFLPAMTALEQNAKQYPKHRDPYTYPAYGKNILKQMLQWILS